MRNSVATRIADRLRDEIEAGAFAAEGRIPTERELAERFAVARNTVRRAIEDLQSSGLVVRHVGRGTFLTATDPMETTPIANAVESDISPRDLIEARLMLEPAAAAAAAANAREADILRLQQVQDASAATKRMEAFERYDAEIHRLIFSMTQNQVLLRIDAILGALRDNTDWLAAKRRGYSDAQKARYVAQHGEIIRAVRERSPKAAREAMTVHLEDVRRVLLEG